MQIQLIYKLQSSESVIWSIKANTYSVIQHNNHNPSPHLNTVFSWEKHELGERENGLLFGHWTFP